MGDADTVAEPKVKGKLKEEPEDIGTVSDFIELINTTVGKHFKCCICFSILEDPVMLPCNHPLCRGCATQCLRQNQRCPQCLTAIPNLRMLQGRSIWITEMVCSLKSCLNEVGVSLTQHAPVPPKYRDKSPPKTGAAGAAVRQRARARARASSGDASRAQVSAVSCGGGGGSSSDGRDRGGARRNGGGRISNDAGGATSISPHSSLSDDKNAAAVPLPPSSLSPPVPPPRPFVVGDLVFVEHRTWPGMNKHGGVALVTAVPDPAGSRYDVKYTVGQKHDRGVEARYVHSYSFPDETVGSRSRRSGGGTRAGRQPGGSSGRARVSLPPRGRSRVPVSAPPAVSVAHSTTDGRAATATAPASLAAAASPVPNPSPPRHEHAADDRGEPMGAGEEIPDKERTAAAATVAAFAASAAAAEAIAIATASSPAAADAAGDKGCGGCAEVPGHRHDDDEASRCDGADGHVAEGSHVPDAASTSTIREEDAGRADGAGYSCEDGSGIGYGGGSYDDGHDHDSEAAAPGREGDIDRDGEIEVPAEALSRPDVAENETSDGKLEDGRDEATRIEEIKDLTDDRRKSPSISGVGSGVAGGAADGPAAPLSPTARSNLPWHPPPPPQSDGLGNELSAAGQRRRHDSSSPFPASGTRDTSDLMLASAAEGLVALASNHRTAPATTAVVSVEEAEKERRMEDAEDTESEAETSTPHPQLPGDHSDVHLRQGSSNPRGEAAPSARASLPTGSSAATAASPLLSHSGNSSRPGQHQDDTPVATAALTTAAAAATAGGNRQDNGGDDGDPTPSTCSMEAAEGIGGGDGGTRADTTVNLAASPSTASPPPPPFARPSPSQHTPPALHQTPRQVMPPPPPLFPSPTLTRPPNSSLASSSTPVPPPPPPPPKVPSFKVGDLVSVPSRSSPGVNKEGGVAKVALARPDGTFDVKYIVRQGREKGVAAAILSPYKVDDDGGGGGGGSGKRDGGERGAAGPSSSFPPPSMAAASRGGGGTSVVRRTPRSNKGWCSPDIAAGQANAACLNYMLGDTQHPELDLDPDLGELLDPNEGTSSSSSSSGGGVKSVTGAPTGKARRQRAASSSATAAKVTVVEEGEGLGGDSDDGKVVSGWEIRDSSDEGRRKNSGSGNKRKRPARGRGDDSDDEGDGNGTEKHSCGGSQSHGGPSQGHRRCRRRRSSSEGSGSGSGIGDGDGDGSEKDVFDITALTADSDSEDEDNVAALLVAAAADYDGANGSSGHEIFDITALSPGSDVVGSGAPATKKRSRPSGGKETARAAASAAASAEAVGKKRSSGTDKGKSKPLGGKAGGSRSRGGGASGGSNEQEKAGSGCGRRGQTAAVNPQAENPVVLTLSGSTAEILTLANALVKSLGWRVEPKYTEAVTHVVCGTVQKTTKAKAKVRSAKFLRAVASGKWVVTEAWLQECRRRGVRVKEEAFEVSGDRKSAVPSAPTRSRLAHADPGRPGLFHGISFHFRGQFGTTGSPPLSELEAMLLDNGGRVVSTIESLFTSPVDAGGGGSNDGSGRRSDSGSSGSSSGSGSGSGAWRPRRVVIFQPSSESPEEDVRVLEEDLASVVEAELSKRTSKTRTLAAEGARARGGGAGGWGSGPPDNMAIEIVKPIWLVDSVGCFRVLGPSVDHRPPSSGAVA